MTVVSEGTPAALNPPEQTACKNAGLVDLVAMELVVAARIALGAIYGDIARDQMTEIAAAREALVAKGCGGCVIAKACLDSRDVPKQRKP